VYPARAEARGNKRGLDKYALSEVGYPGVDIDQLFEGEYFGTAYVECFADRIDAIEAAHEVMEDVSDRDRLNGYAHPVRRKRNGVAIRQVAHYLE